MLPSPIEHSGHLNALDLTPRPRFRHCLRGRRPDDSGLRSPRSCAVSYPSLELGGVLWVWGEGGREAAAEAATKQPPLAPEVQVGRNISWTLSLFRCSGIGALEMRCRQA